MRRDCTIAIAVALIVSVTSIAGAGDSDVLRDNGMLGEWAADCRLPPGPTNPRTVYSPSQQGDVATLTRNGTREVVGIIRNVQAISSGSLGWSFTFNAVTYNIVIERAGERYRSLESIGSDGKTYIKNGFMTDWGRGAPWLEKCSTPSATADVTERALVDAWQGCYQGKDRDRAIRDCALLIRVQPSGALGYNHRGLAYGAIGENDKAIADFTEAVRLDPQYASAYNNRAWTYFAAGKAAQGLPDIQRALELWPNDAGSVDTRAHIFEALGRREDAISDYRRVLSLIPAGHSKAKETLDALRRLGASP